MTSNPRDQTLRIGAWELIPARGLLRRNGEETRLEPRHADLLIFLAEHPGEVVSTEEILSRVWSGTLVGDHSLYQAIAKLRKALGDDSAQKRYIETVPKRGYRLLAEVVKTAEIDGDREPTPPRSPTPWTASPRHLLPLAAALLVVILALSFWHFLPQAPDEATPAIRPRLLVLPFASLSDKAADHFIAEGFSIELAHLLGVSHQLQVLGPVSAKLAAESALDVTEVGQRLDADFVVTGSLRRAADLLRISATITDTASGSQRWSQIFERHDGDIFGLQAEVARQIAEALQANLQGRPTPPASAASGDAKAAYGYFLLGQSHRRNRSAASLTLARDAFEQALQLDPGLVSAKRELAATQLLLSFYDNLGFREALEQAEPLLEQALRATPDDPELLGTIGLSHYLKGSYGLAEEYLRRAITADPSYSEGWMWLGLAERQQGRLRDAIDAFRQARALEPLMVSTSVNLANALSWSGEPQAGRKLLEELVQTIRDAPQAYRVLSGIALESGDLVAAYRWAQTALSIDPEDSVSKGSMALVLAYLDQYQAVRELLTSNREQPTHGRAVQLYLDRMSLMIGSVPIEDVADRYESRLIASPRVQEIEWRLANARLGLADAFAGDLDSARDRLARSLEGRVHPIERTDYDLFVCTTLVDVQTRLGAHDAARQWLRRCQGDFEAARQYGWDSLAMRYVRARLARLGGDSTQALEHLRIAVAHGFRNGKLLAADPVFEPLRQTAAFQDIQTRIQDLVRKDWEETKNPLACQQPNGASCDPAENDPGAPQPQASSAEPSQTDPHKNPADLP
ncbi:tetratricopeptide repeat protein [Thiorhodococcus mannitoliphagus]|uniref:Tetratricopeptide repeat protein n=1 Tax=Thiorhodococcus mannitoliphagus TaxID=329406 RepID=A0A6P1DXZ7_9GAMM|nr:winged helix-turn-helix domain-containing protein [Thiorhodococcus mannitoliphagus]NEX21953.1 tetratricopeptide repeat protein [Thiorhodococcus mannitoliphagus]